MKRLMTWIESLTHRLSFWYDGKSAEWERKEEDWYNRAMAKSLFEPKKEDPKLRNLLILVTCFVVAVTVLVLGMDQFLFGAQL